MFAIFSLQRPVFLFRTCTRMVVLYGRNSRSGRSTLNGIFFHACLSELHSEMCVYKQDQITKKRFHRNIYSRLGAIMPIDGEVLSLIMVSFAAFFSLCAAGFVVHCSGSDWGFGRARASERRAISGKLPNFRIPHLYFYDIDILSRLNL